MEKLFKREKLITITLSKDDWIEIIILAVNSLSYTGEDSEAIERLEQTITSNG